MPQNISRICRQFVNCIQCLEDDAVTFDLFLKENDKNSVEAIKQAEAETKAKLERVASVKDWDNL